MEVETRNESFEIAEEAMAVDSSDKESYSSDEGVDKNKSDGLGNNVKNKLLLFKFESTKKTNKPHIKIVDKSIENEEDDDDVIDISNEVLVGDLHKKKKKCKNSSKSTKKKRKSLEKNKEVTLEGKEELKENQKSNENVLKDDKEKVKPAEKCTDKKESTDKIEDTNGKKKEEVNSEKDSETSKTLKANAKKSPNPSKSKSNEKSSGTPGLTAKPLLTMDKFIIRKKTLEEVEKERLAKQNEKKINSNEVMIIDEEAISKETSSSSKESSVKNLKKDEVTEQTFQETKDKCDNVKSKELDNKESVCTKTSINSESIECMEQVKVVLDRLSFNETEKSIEQPTEVDDNPKQSAEVSPKSNNDQADQSTPLAKRRQSVNYKTPKCQRTLEPKKLTPKQIEKQEELARKKEELARKKEEKEQEKERQRLEREQKKLEEEEKRRKEREEKEEARRAEKEARERQRREQEEARRREKESKEQLRLMQIELKSKERAAREEERKVREEERKRKEEAEKEKKEKAAAAFASFFVAKKGGGLGEEEEGRAEVEAVPAEKTLNFMPFQIKGDMRMAPTARTMFTPERSARLDSVLHASEEAPERKALYLRELKRQGYVIGKGEKTWPADTEDEPDVIIVESEFSDGGVLQGEDSRGGFYSYPPRRVKRRAKLLQFHDNRRPPYFGTWSKRTLKISGRRPFRQDEALFEYDVDSDEEWEEEGEGESLRGSDDEKEEDEEEGEGEGEGGDQYEVDNQMFVPHGYLSDEEERDDDLNLDPEAHKMKLKLMELEFEEQMKQKTERLKPRLIGCVYLSNSGHYSTLTVGPHIRDLLLTRRAVYDEASVPITTTAEEPPPAPLISSPPSGSGPPDSAGVASERLTTKDCIPDSEMADLIRLVHGSHVSRKNLSKEFSTFVASGGKDISLGLIQKTIREIAEWTLCPLPECTPNTYPRKCWFVKPEIRDKFGLTDFLACQNSWKFIVEPPTSEKTGTPTAKKECGTPSAGGNEKDSNNTPTSSRKRKTPKRIGKDADNTPIARRSKQGGDSTPTDSPLSGQIASSGRNEEEEMGGAASGEPAAPPHGSLITKFTKVLSEEERIEQLTKMKVIKTTSKPTKMMPKSKLELFKAQSAASPGVKKRASLITIAKSADTPTDSNAKCKAGQNPEVIDLDDGSNEDKVIQTDQDKRENRVESNVSNPSGTETRKTPTVKKGSPPVAPKSKTPQSGAKVAKKRKSTPGASESSPPSAGAAKTPAVNTPTSAKAAAKTPSGNSSGAVSIMSFITKERPKRKSDDGTEEMKREEQGGRKKLKLNKAGGEGGGKAEVECVQIESSNEGW